MTPAYIPIHDGSRPEVRTRLWQNTGHLDRDQMFALDEIFIRAITVVMGPPGTGKTTLMAHTIMGADEGKRVLCTSDSNAAVEGALHAVLKLVEKGILPTKPRIRWYRAGTASNELSPEFGATLDVERCSSMLSKMTIGLHISLDNSKQLPQTILTKEHSELV